MGMNSGNKRLQMQTAVDDRRARVASYKVRGFSLRQMIAAMEEAKFFNPTTGKPWSIAMLAADAKFLEERWRAEALGDITEVKSRELAKLDELEAEAWKAWHRGIGKKQQTFTKRKSGGKRKGGQGEAGADDTEASVRTEDLNGDPRYMNIILECQGRRAKMMGLDMPTKIAPTTPDGDRPFHGVMLIPAPISPEGWEDMAQRTQAALKEERG